LRNWKTLALEKKSQDILPHRVGRVLSFFSSRRNWDSPNPSPAGECAPPPPVLAGGAHSLAREGLGESHPKSDEGTYTMVLFIYMYFVHCLVCQHKQFLQQNKTRSSDLSCFAQILPGFLKLLTASAPSGYGVIIHSAFLLPLHTRVTAS
jgi:hypothetical protein